jgi:hypothetical protein
MSSWMSIKGPLTFGFFGFRDLLFPQPGIQWTAGDCFGLMRHGTRHQTVKSECGHQRVSMP